MHFWLHMCIGISLGIQEVIINSKHGIVEVSECECSSSTYTWVCLLLQFDWITRRYLKLKYLSHMFLFCDSPRSRFNTFVHQTGCTIILSRLVAQKCDLENLQHLVHVDIPKTKVGLHMQHLECTCAGVLAEV